MILVLVGHVPPSDLASKVIYSFHIPLFFALSGLLHNPDRFAHLGGLLKARSRTLLLPYFAYSAIGYCAWLALWVSRHNPWNWTEVLEPLTGTLLGIRNSSFFHGTLWFVACLFLTEILFHCIHRLLGRKSLLAFLMAFPFAAYAFHPLVAIRFFPWSVDCAFLALVFFSFGHLLREFRANSPGAWSS
ncbi:MAG TPA: acyltransferase family protein, partial [Fibrobacteria bacterium]|nr:acyltransferase family protein [Fibrobacteria bacterium]